MGWPCYWLAETGLVALGLRRYVRISTLSPREFTCAAGWHQGLAWRGLTVPERWTSCDGRRVRAPAGVVDHGDPAWPAACQEGCGYRFQPGDEWQEWEEAVYAAPGGGRFVLHQGWPPPPGIALAGPGASWDAWWLPSGWRGPDGIGLAVRCPRGDGTPGWFHDWLVDAPATGSGGRWTRTGDPRTGPVTVTPSIAIGDPGGPGYYHGWLTAGVLADPLR
jgi:hypothetical protein